MKKRLFILLLLICLRVDAGIAQAWEALSDSLRTVLNAYPNDQHQADSLNAWSFELRMSAPEQSALYAKAALLLSQKANYAQGQGDSYVRLGILAKNEGEIDQAKSYYLKAARLRRQIGDKPGEASCYNNLGNLATQQGLFEDAVAYYRQGVQILTGVEPVSWQASLHSNLATALRYLTRYEEALLEFERSLELAGAQNNPEALAYAELDLGNLLLSDLQQYDRARRHLLSALEIFTRLNHEVGKAKCNNGLGNIALKEHQYDTALGYFQLALAGRQFFTDEDAAIIHRNIGSIFSTRNQYGLAQQNYQAALKIFRQLQNQYETASVLAEMATAYKDQADFKQAVSLYQEALANISHLEVPALKSQILLYLSDCHDQLGNHEEALALQGQYLELQDELFQNKQNATDLQLQLEEERVKSKETELALEQQRSKTLQIYNYVGFGSLWVVAGIAALIVYTLRQKRRLAEKEAQIALQKVDEVLRDRELEATYAWLDGQEEARRKIGAELHDGLGGLLAMVKLYFTQVNSRLDNLEEENRNQYEKATRLLDDASSEVRRISHEMTSLTLTKFGLKAQIESMVDTLRGTNALSVELSTHGLQDRLPSALEVKIYRIVQELVTNVLRHAKATKLTIQLNRFADIVNIMIEDNGVGFDPEAAKADGGLGLRNIEARVHDLEGTLAWDAQPGRGTMVSIDIPLILKTSTTTAVPA